MSALLTAYCVLRTAYCLLLTAYCLLLTAYCLLLTAHKRQLTTHSPLLTTLLLTVHYLLLTTSSPKELDPSCTDEQLEPLWVSSLAAEAAGGFNEKDLETLISSWNSRQKAIRLQRTRGAEGRLVEASDQAAAKDDLKVLSTLWDSTCLDGVDATFEERAAKLVMMWGGVARLKATLCGKVTRMRARANTLQAAQPDV